VQGCPNEAIAIKVVSVTGASANPLVPGVVDSSYTLPQTRYVSHSPVPPQSQPADADLLRVEATHMPLVLMLTLTQLSAGAWLAALGPAPTWLVWSAFFLSAAGVLASVAHLGQPLKAWRAFLGWRRSWLSREILLFGGFLATGFAAALGVFPASVVAALGVLSVFCSVMVYVDTRRPFWGFWPTFGKFFGTAIISYFLLENSLAGGALLLLKVAAEGLFLCTRSKSARILRGPLRVVTAARFAAAFLALLALPFAPLLALLLFALGEFCERIGFFRAVVAFKMPGVC
jgi:DMSO reductase anchor subunit